MTENPRSTFRETFVDGECPSLWSLLPHAAVGTEAFKRKSDNYMDEKG